MSKVLQIKFKVSIMNEIDNQDRYLQTLYAEAYLAEKCIARDLETNDEQATVEEEHVSLPVTRVVVSLQVDCLRYRPDSCSSHY